MTAGKDRAGKAIVRNLIRPYGIYGYKTGLASQQDRRSSHVNFQEPSMKGRKNHRLNGISGHSICVSFHETRKQIKTGMGYPSRPICDQKCSNKDHTSVTFPPLFLTIDREKFRN
jgi:hypothetical protein